MYIKKDKLNNIKDIVLRNIRENGYTEEQFFNEKEPYIYQLYEAVEFTRNYLMLNDGTVITVIGDYDVDGIAATTNMYWGLVAYIKQNKINATVKTRLPRRFTEGYGLSEKIVDEIDEGLIITVDNGIAALPAIKKAKEKGLSVIVTDHHLPPADSNGKMILPPADIIVDPHIYPEKSDFEDYCGAGLAYRFVKKLLPDMKLLELLSLTSVATIADVMPLYGANRKLVIDGLNATNNKNVLPGMRELMIKLSMFDGHATEGDYGFKIGPTFNASGRLHDTGADKVLRLLKMNRDDPKIPFKADNLVKTNDKRKEIQRKDIDRVMSNYRGERPIVVYDPEIGEGIIGLVAGRMTEDFHCPSICFTKTEKEGIIKGSARSIPEIHLKNVLDKIQDKMIGYGGHAGAAGLSIELSRLEEFKEAFKEACGEIPTLSEDVYYDIEIDSIEELPELNEQLKLYEPYGESNPRIVFRLKYKVDVQNYKRIGDGSHFMIKDENIRRSYNLE